MDGRYRKVVFYKRSFLDFYDGLHAKVQEKMDYVFKVIETAEVVPVRFLKHIEGTSGLYEVRIAYQGNIYRIFCCFDEGRLVVLFNVFQKKTKKTPKKEIDLATKLKEEYFNSKNR